MRRRLTALTLAALSVAALAGPVGASETGIVDVETDGPFYVCVESRLLTRDYCVYYNPPMDK